MRVNLLRLCLLPLLLVAATPGASAAESPARKKVVFTAQGLPNPRSVDVQAVAARHILRRFLTQNPDIRIEPFAIPTIEGMSMDAGPLMAIAAGTPPHAMFVNFRQSSTYLERGFLAPQEVLLARVLSDNPQVRETDADGKWLADPTDDEVADALKAIRARVADPAWPVVHRKRSPQEAAHVWAMPTDNLVMALLYRKDLFAAAGLDPNRPPDNWDELLRTTRALTRPERKQYGLAIGTNLANSTYTFLVSNGGRVVDQQEDGSWRAVWDSEAAAEAYAFVWELVHGKFERDGEVIPGCALVAGNELNDKWKRGEIAMRFAYLDEQMLADINPQLVGIAPVPEGLHGGRGSEVNAKMLGIFADSTPEQKLAVMRYIWYRTGPEAEEITTRILVENGFGPFVNPELLRRYGYEDILRKVPKGWQQTFEAAMANGVPEPYGRNTQNVYRYLTRPIATALQQDFEGLPEEQRLATIKGLLDDAALEFNRKVLGVIPPNEMRNRRIVAWIVVIVVVISFVTTFVWIWRYFSKVSQTSANKPKLRKFIWGYLLLTPAMALVLGWSYLPMLGGIAMAVMDYQLVLDSVFVGVDNFASALFDERFWAGFGRTFYFVALSLVLGFWPPILLAILLDEVPTETLKYIFRTIYYLPAIISGIIVIFLWKQLLEPYGVLNSVLLTLNDLPAFAATLVKLTVVALWGSLLYLLIRLPFKLDEMHWGLRAAMWLIAGAVAFGTIAPLFAGGLDLGEVASLFYGRFSVERAAFLQDPATAMIWCVVPAVWAGSGPGCLLYLAALKTVPSDLYEAAAIDGANAWHKVFYITLPRLKFLIVIQFIAAVVGAFKGGANFILAMTGGGPNEGTMVLALEIFTKAFVELEFGFAAAMAWILGTTLIGFTAYQLKMLSRAEFTAAGGRK